MSLTPFSSSFVSLAAGEEGGGHSDRGISQDSTVTMSSRSCSYSGEE
jgi:hypothetical protein